MANPIRCPWAQGDPLYERYHDLEWGVPIYQDRKLFEFLILEGAQAGLSWITVLKKRQDYRKAFADFDPKRVAKFGRQDIQALLKNTGIIRNRLKIHSAVQNAKAFLQVQKEFGTFAKYMWSWVGGEPRQNKWGAMKEVPATNPVSKAWSKDLKKRGFNFVGPTILYAHMQAVGMVNDHLKNCFRHAQVAKLGKKIKVDNFS